MDRKKPICAVAASIFTAAYHILKDGTEHQALGADYFDRRPAEVKASRLVARLKKRNRYELPRLP